MTTINVTKKKMIFLIKKIFKSSFFTQTIVRTFARTFVRLNIINYFYIYSFVIVKTDFKMCQKYFLYRHFTLYIALLPLRVLEISIRSKSVEKKKINIELRCEVDQG